MMSEVVKYSVVIPTLNGYKTLSKTLPGMLSIDRSDIQWVISDNCSDDGLFEFVTSLNDSRITLVRPEKRLQVGAHLDFAYRHAVGTWQGHLGDDDFLLSSRFTILDKIIAKHQGVELIRGNLARYYWHDFPVSHQANRLSPSKYFSGLVSIYNGAEYARRMLKVKQIYGGGSWVVNKSVVEKIREKLGYFSPPQTVEFFSMRAAALGANKVAEVDLPIWIAGRHAGSVGSQALMSEDKVKTSDWDWNFEDPDDHVYCPYQYKGYVPISLDAAMQIVDEFYECTDLSVIDKKYWAKAVLIETEHLIKEGKLCRSYRKQRDIIIKKEVGFSVSLLLLAKLYRVYNRMPSFFRRMYVKVKSRSLVPNYYSFGWKDLEDVERKYKKRDIVGLAGSLDEENLQCIHELK